MVDHVFSYIVYDKCIVIPWFICFKTPWYFTMDSLFQNTMDYNGFHGIYWYFTMVYLFQNTMDYHGFHGIYWYFTMVYLFQWYIFIRVCSCGIFSCQQTSRSASHHAHWRDASLIKDITCQYKHIYIYRHANTYACMHSGTHARTRACIHTHTYAHTHTHTYAHTLDMLDEILPKQLN